jgi:hypothetical protein
VPLDRWLAQFPQQRRAAPFHARDHQGQAQQGMRCSLGPRRRWQEQIQRVLRGTPLTAANVGCG